jgi:hypothetical protein
VKLVRLATLVVATVLLAGCGGGGDSGGSDNGVSAKSADQIVADATAAAKSASSVYVHGSTASGSEPLEIDMHLVAGKGGAGELTANGQTFQVVRLDDKAYIKGDDAFWKQIGGDAAVQLFHGKWLVAPSTDPDFSSFTSLTDIAQFFEGVLSGHGSLTKGDETTINGTSAIAVEDTSKDGTLYVATEGTPYPLQIEGGGKEAGTITFEDWDESYTVEAPEDAVDISQLKGG